MGRGYLAITGPRSLLETRLETWIPAVPSTSDTDITSRRVNFAHIRTLIARERCFEIYSFCLHCICTCGPSYISQVISQGELGYLFGQSFLQSGIAQTFSTTDKWSLVLPNGLSLADIRLSLDFDQSCLTISRNPRWSLSTNRWTPCEGLSVQRTL
jgi:hypothetical protein